MALKAIDYYPDYMKDFEDINALAKVVDLWISKVTKQLGNDVRDVVGYESGITQRWEDVVVLRSSSEKNRQKLFKKRPMMNIDDIIELVRCWFTYNEFLVEFDPESLTFFMKIDQGEANIKKYLPYCRAILPCNMVLSYEKVEEIETVVDKAEV